MLHIKDKKASVEKGFMLFAIHLNPNALHDIIIFDKNKSVLIETLIYLGFNEQCSNIISETPSKFLWSDLLSFFKGKLDSMITQCVLILNKMDIVRDPGSMMNKLIDIFA